MSKPILFISDLHLDANRPDTSQLFYHFLDNIAPAAQALYILGDLFEVWIGDDDPSDFAQQILHKLKQASERGLPIFVMFGNRDFLMGEQFEKISGCTLIVEPLKIDLFGTQTLLLHGDTLCIDDLEYQAFRVQVRDPQRQQWFLSKPFVERIQIAKQARDASRTSTQTKSMGIMDVNSNAVLEAFRKEGVTQMIHGHTHRPAIHKIPTEQGELVRIVLADWYQHGGYLEATQNGCRLITL